MSNSGWGQARPAAPSFDLSDKRVVVVGGKKAIGLGVEEASHAMGAAVTVASRRKVSAELRPDLARFNQVVLDIRDEAAVQAANTIRPGFIDIDFWTPCPTDRGGHPRQGLPGFLRKVMANAARNLGVLAATGELFGLESRQRKKCPIRVTLERDGGKADGGAGCRPPFCLVVSGIALCKPKPPATAADRDSRSLQGGQSPRVNLRRVRPNGWGPWRVGKAVSYSCRRIE